MAWTEHPDGWWLTEPAFCVRVDPSTGALDRLTLTADPEQMNWVASGTNGWHPRSNGWGLGVVGGHPSSAGANAPARWQHAAIAVDGDTLTAGYDVSGWHVQVVRRPDGDGLDERITLRNTLDEPRDVGSLYLYTPFNTDLVGAAEDLQRRCHAHVWAGGENTWIKAVRWSGEGPHVALAVHTGSFIGYGLDAVTEYAGSPVRGDICLVAHDAYEPSSSPLTVAPGATIAFGWRVFAHDGDFPSSGPADRYVLTVGESTQVQGFGTYTATTPGVETVGPATMVTVPELDELLTERTHFIVANQQDSSGALLPYDNRYDAMLRHPSRADFNDGRERVGMGVLLAQRRRTDPALAAASDSYADFVATRLQSAAGDVYDSSTDRTARRLYNYPWVSRLWLEMYAATGRAEYVDRFHATTSAFYRAGGAEFYAIGVPILRTRQLLGSGSDVFTPSIDFIRSRGADYPAHEVPYEQTIVGPAATMLLEMHLVTGDPALRRAAQPHLTLLEQFGGPQPDGRLHDVPIRHWDGYWFGARERWGDVMPHHWSAVTAWAWALRAAAAPDDGEHWWHRATQLSKATLHTFRPGGRASAAFVYPMIVNGNHEHQFDPLANDQDWALVYAQDILALRAGL